MGNIEVVIQHPGERAGKTAATITHYMFETAYSDKSIISLGSQPHVVVDVHQVRGLQVTHPANRKPDHTAYVKFEETHGWTLLPPGKIISIKVQGLKGQYQKQIIVTHQKG